MLRHNLSSQPKPNHPKPRLLFENELRELHQFDYENLDILATLVFKHAAVTGKLLLHVNQVLSNITSDCLFGYSEFDTYMDPTDQQKAHLKNIKRDFILKVSKTCPSLFIEAVKVKDRYIIKALLSKNSRKIWEDLNQLIRTRQISSDILNWLLTKLKAISIKMDRHFNTNINQFNKESQELLCTAISYNDVNSAVILTKHLQYQYSPDNLYLLSLQADPVLQRIYVEYLLIEYRRNEEALITNSCYQPGWFKGPTRLDKVNAAAAMLTCLENNTSMTDKATLAVIAGSKKLTAIHAQVVTLLTLQKPKDAPISENSAPDFRK